jgi:hypothetical protein
VLTPADQIESRFNAAVPGQTFCLRAGTYNQRPRLTPSGSPLLPITLEGYPGDARPIIHPGTLGDGFRIAGSYVHVRGVVVEGTHTDAAGCNAMGVYFVGSVHDSELADSEIRSGTAGSGVFSEPESARLTIVRNVSHGNVDLIDCNGTQAHGFYIQGSGHLVANNIAYDHSEGYGIQAYPEGTDSIFAENTIVDNALGCFVLSYAAVLANNICAFNGGFVSGAGGLGCVISANIRYASGSERPSSCVFSRDIARDPLFVDRSGNDYRVAAGSPAIDAADLLYFYSPAADNLMRPIGNAPDIGAYER